MATYFALVNEVLGSSATLGSVHIAMGKICKEMESNIYCMIPEFLFFDSHHHNLSSLFKAYVFSFHKSVV